MTDFKPMTISECGESVTRALLQREYILKQSYLIGFMSGLTGENDGRIRHGDNLAEYERGECDGDNAAWRSSQREDEDYFYDDDDDDIRWEECA